MFLGRDAGHQRDYSDDVAAQIDAEVNALHRPRPRRSARDPRRAPRHARSRSPNALIERETVEDVELAELFKNIGTWPGMDGPDDAPPAGRSSYPHRSHSSVVTPRPVPVAPAHDALEAVDAHRSRVAPRPAAGDHHVTEQRRGSRVACRFACHRRDQRCRPRRASSGRCARSSSPSARTPIATACSTRRRVWPGCTQRSSPGSTTTRRRT